MLTSKRIGFYLLMSEPYIRDLLLAYNDIQNNPVAMTVTIIIMRLNDNFGCMKIDNLQLLLGQKKTGFMFIYRQAQLKIIIRF